MSAIKARRFETAFNTEQPQDVVDSFAKVKEELGDTRKVYLLGDGVYTANYAAVIPERLRFHDTLKTRIQEILNDPRLKESEVIYAIYPYQMDTLIITNDSVVSMEFEDIDDVIHIIPDYVQGWTRGAAMTVKVSDDKYIIIAGEDD